AIMEAMILQFPLARPIPIIGHAIVLPENITYNRTEGGVVHQHPRPAPMEPGVAVDDGDLAVATLDGDSGQRTELRSATLRRRLVRVVGFGGGLLNRLRNPRTHRTLAIAAVGDHLA